MAEVQGKRIGKYEVLTRLAVGGMAELFLAFVTGPAHAAASKEANVQRPHMALISCTPQCLCAMPQASWMHVGQQHQFRERNSSDSAGQNTNAPRAFSRASGGGRRDAAEQRPA